MRVGCCRTRSSSRPSLSSSLLRAMSASWPMTPNASSRLRNMENSLCRCRVLTRIASVIRPVETRSNRVISAQGITNLTVGENRQRIVDCMSQWVLDMWSNFWSLVRLWKSCCPHKLFRTTFPIHTQLAGTICFRGVLIVFFYVVVSVKCHHVIRHHQPKRIPEQNLQFSVKFIRFN